MSNGRKFPGGWRRDGFTLIELILVMALLAIVMAFSAPALTSFFRGRTLDSEARRFMALTRYGQSRAISEGVPMMLWIDTRRGTYGLQEEPGYNAVDTKAIDFVLGKDLRIGVDDVPAASGQLSQSRQTALSDATVRRLYFQPGGFIAETSPQSVIIGEKTGDSLWITQSRNRLNYEIHTNSLQRAFR